MKYTKEIEEIITRAVYEGQDNWEVKKTIKRGVDSIENLLQVKCGDANPKGNIALIYKGGCKEFVSFFDSYRCTGCGGRFHKECILKHFELEKEHDWGRQEERKDIQALIDRAVRERVKNTINKFKNAKEIVVDGQRFLELGDEKVPFGYPYLDTKEKYILRHLTDSEK